MIQLFQQGLSQGKVQESEAGFLSQSSVICQNPEEVSSNASKEVDLQGECG